MKKNILQSIIEQKKTCYFVSPHFDDAVLSAGALMTYLAAFTKIVVINIFTKSDASVSTFSAKTYTKQCGYTDAEQLYSDRANEDALVFKHIAHRIFNLGFTDALWRKKYRKDMFSRLFSSISEFQVIYPTYRFHIIKGTIAKQDMHTLDLIKAELQEIIMNRSSVIFCPFAIGNHVDHVMARRACEDIFSSVIYWSDFPYNLNEQYKTNRFAAFSFTENLSQKYELVKGYKTQYTAMFGKGFHLRPETFLLKK